MSVGLLSVRGSNYLDFSVKIEHNPCAQTVPKFDFQRYLVFYNKNLLNVSNVDFHLRIQL